jgi:DNA repair ATPase RecN
MPSVVADSNGIYRSTEVRLREGTNVLGARAISASGEVESEPLTTRLQFSPVSEEWERKYSDVHAEFEQLKADVGQLCRECEDSMERDPTELAQVRAKIDEIKRLAQ